MKTALAAFLLAIDSTLPTGWPTAAMANPAGAVQEFAQREHAQNADVTGRGKPLPGRMADLQTPQDQRPEAAPVRKTLKLTQPLTGTIVLENTDIDASAVARVFDVNDGRTDSIKLTNCTINNATSVIEGWADGLVVEWRGVTVGQCKRYGIYLESKGRTTRQPITDRIANTVKLYGCNFASSENETPVRLMYGVFADIQDSAFIDSVDIGGNKANIGLRLHCHTVYIARSKSSGIKLGHATHKSKRIECVEMDFSRGHFAMEGCEIKPVYTDCKWPAK